MMSDSMYKFISEQSKQSNISKADYIRNLIYSKILKNNR
jgi:parvulin-like peptidyl-prolyl isomerase